MRCEGAESRSIGGGDWGQAGVGSAMDQATADRLMLKFRPIAPKPVDKGSASTTGRSQTIELMNLAEAKVKLRKRKHVRIHENSFKRSSAKRTAALSRWKKEDGSLEEARREKKRKTDLEEENVSTSRLVPKKAEEHSAVLASRENLRSQIGSTNGNFSTPGRSCNMQPLSTYFNGAFSSLAPLYLHGSDGDKAGQASHSALNWPDQPPPESLSCLSCQLIHQPPRWPKMVQDLGVSGPRMVAVVETVMVDCHTCADPRELGGTDAEIIENLGRDTSPGFVSDSSNKIRWVNGAFRRMVTPMEGQISSRPLHPQEVAVVLVAKDELPRRFRAFSGQVKVRLQQGYYRRYGVDEKFMWEKSCSKWQQVVPCDVWRMDCGAGGFAWRLDLKAALTLGRLS